MTTDVAAPTDASGPAVEAEGGVGASDRLDRLERELADLREQVRQLRESLGEED